MYFAPSDVDVLRTLVDGTGQGAGCRVTAAAQGAVLAVEGHHVAFLHLNVVGTGGVLGNGLLLAVVDGVVDVASQRDAIVEGDGDLSVILWQNRQRRGFIHSGQLPGRDGVYNNFKGYALGNLGRTDGDGGLASGDGRHPTRLTHRGHGRRAGSIDEWDAGRIDSSLPGGRLTYRQRQRGIVDLDVGGWSTTTARRGIVFTGEDGICQFVARCHSHCQQQQEPVKDSSVLFHT